MTTSQTPFLAEISAGHAGPTIPTPTRAYFQQRLRNRVFNFLLGKFMDAQESGLNKAILARRIGKTPDVINRWLGTPTNLTLDTISDLLLGIAAEELELASSSPITPSVQSNSSRFEELNGEALRPIDTASKQEQRSNNGAVALAETVIEFKQSSGVLASMLGAS